MTYRTSCYVCIVLLLGLATSGAARASLIFEYNATCAAGCADFGLADGTPVSGTIEFDATNFAPGATIGSSDVIDYSFVFGSFALEYDPGHPLPSFWGRLDTTATSFQEFEFQGTEAPVPLNFGDAISSASLHARPYGTISTIYSLTRCPNGWQCLSFPKLAFLSPSGAFTLIATTVPEPGTVTLFGVGLLGLMLVARRRRRAA